jgi:hypothetical protein
MQRRWSGRMLTMIMTMRGREGVVPREEEEAGGGEEVGRVGGIAWLSARSTGPPAMASSLGASWGTGPREMHQCLLLHQAEVGEEVRAQQLGRDQDGMWGRRGRRSGRIWKGVRVGVRQRMILRFRRLFARACSPPSPPHHNSSSSSTCSITRSLSKTRMWVYVPLQLY